nr:uncharacterized protein LOC104096303 [Nicotiana tomentosiformis]
MSNIPSDMNEGNHLIPLAVVFLVHGENTIFAVEEEAFPSVEEIIPRYPDSKLDLQRLPEVMTEKFQSMMTARCLAEFKTKFNIPDHVELIPVGSNEVHVHHPGYCALYSYPFAIGYLFPPPSAGGGILSTLQSLPHSAHPLCLQSDQDAVEVCRTDRGRGHGVSLNASVRTQFLLRKDVKSSTSWGKCLVVKMDDKGGQQFWLDYFFVKTEAVVADVTGFPKAWNLTRSVWGAARRNRVPVHLFRRRSVAMPSVSAHISSIVPAPSWIPLNVEDEEVSPHDTYLKARKRKTVDVEEGVPVAINLSEDVFVVRETTTIHIGENVGGTF